MLAINKNKLVSRAIIEMVIDVAYHTSRSFVAMTVMKQNETGSLESQIFHVHRELEINKLFSQRAELHSFKATIDIYMFQST